MSLLYSWLLVFGHLCDNTTEDIHVYFVSPSNIQACGEAGYREYSIRRLMEGFISLGSIMTSISSLSQANLQQIFGWWLGSVRLLRRVICRRIYSQITSQAILVIQDDSLYIHDESLSYMVKACCMNEHQITMFSFVEVFFSNMNTVVLWLHTTVSWLLSIQAFRGTFEAGDIANSP